MKFDKIIDQIEAHPLVVALIVFALGFVIVQYTNNKKATSGAATATGTAKTVGGGDTYAQQYTSYPTNTGTVVNQNQPPPPAPTANPPASTAPVKTGVFNGILGITGSIHPADIGPWTAGRTVNYKGTTYTLKPGADGRLWGDVKGGQSGVLLWNGNDYAGGPRAISA